MLKLLKRVRRLGGGALSSGSEPASPVVSTIPMLASVDTHCLAMTHPLLEIRSEPKPLSLATRIINDERSWGCENHKHTALVKFRKSLAIIVNKSINYGKTFMTTV